MTPEQAKQLSHEYLHRHGLPINDHLPVLESLDELKLQDSHGAARRAVILAHMVGIGYGAPGEALRSALEKHHLIQWASENELRLLGSAQPTEQEIIDSQWLVECLQVMAWAMNLTDAIDPLVGCEEDLASCFPDPFTDPRAFIASAELRSFGELYQQADLHYRLHWAARDSRLNNRPCPLNEGVIRERRKCLDWLIGVGSNWDGIRLDT